MTLHLSQIFFTEARTFMVIPFLLVHGAGGTEGIPQGLKPHLCMSLDARAKAPAYLEAKATTAVAQIHFRAEALT
jgi:hypothetical protein